MLRSLPRRLAKAIRRPSGDHAGSRSSAGSLVSLAWPPPVAAIEKMSKLPARLLSKAIVPLVVAAAPAAAGGSAPRGPPPPRGRGATAPRARTRARRVLLRRAGAARRVVYRGWSLDRHH